MDIKLDDIKASELMSLISEDKIDEYVKLNKEQIKEKLMVNIDANMLPFIMIETVDGEIINTGITLEEFSKF